MIKTRVKISDSKHDLNCIWLTINKTNFTIVAKALNFVAIAEKKQNKKCFLI